MKYPALYVYRSDGANGEELKHSIRSLKNIKNWNGQVFVAGDNERWFSDNIVHIRPWKELNDPQASVEQKMLVALTDDRLSDDFIFMNDDIYITEPLSVTNLHRGELEGSQNGYHQRSKEFTREWLIANGVPDPIDYELHVPMLMNKQKRLDVHNLIKNDVGRIALLHRSIYGNLNSVGGEYYEDAKFRDDNIPDRPIVSSLYFVDGLSSIFPDQSEFEYYKTWSVSIVIPAHNASNTIARCLESIPDHKYIKEVIVMDDGSTDDTVGVVSEYIKSHDVTGRTILKLNDKNMGVGATFNNLIDAATSDYILRIDSDDFFTGKLPAVLDMIDGQDIIYFNMVDNDGSVRPLNQYTKNLTVACCKLYKRSFIGNTRTIESNWGEDRHLHMELQKKRPSELFSNLCAYRYNFPREGSLTDLHIKKKTGEIVSEVTLNIFTNAHNGCTDSPTIFSTYESYIATFGKPASVNVYCDHHPNSELYDRYAESIEEYFGKAPIKTESLSEGYLTSVNNADTEYIFQLEADWSFQNVSHSMDEIITTMQRDGLWHMIFNQHYNVDDPKLAQWQSYLVEHNDIYSKTDRITNNPHIINVEQYKIKAVPLVDWTVPGAGYIEQALEKKFDIAVYGRYGLEPTILHTDMRRGGLK